MVPMSSLLTGLPYPNKSKEQPPASVGGQGWPWAFPKAQRARKRIRPPFSSNTYNRVAPKLWGNRGSIARQPDRRVGHFGSNEIQSADSQRVEVRDPEQQPPISTLIPRLSEGVEREKKQNAWAWSPFH